MSTDAPEDDQPRRKRKDGDPGKIGCLARITPVTTPGCASCLTFVFLVTTTITIWLLFYLDPAHVPWRHSFGTWRIVAIVSLVALIPYVVYKMILWWLQGERSPFPDVEYAWYAGLQALAANGLSLRSLPVYVVIGSSSERQERALLDAAGLRLRVEGIPAGPLPLRWYASTDSIYLFCSDCCWTSALNSLREELAAEQSAKGIGAAEAPPATPAAGVPGFGPGMVPAAEQPAWPPGILPGSMPGEAAASPTPTGAPSNSFGAAPAAVAAPPAGPSPVAGPPVPPAGGGSARGTLMLDQFLSQVNRPEASPASSSPPGVSPGASPALPNFGPTDPAGSRGTMMLDGNLPLPMTTAAAPSPAPAVARDATESEYAATSPLPSGPSATSEPVLVSPQYSSACLQQLQFLGELLRRAREPVCGLNGVLVLMPYEAIYASAPEVEEFQKAVNADLATLQYATRVRCPVTALIVGLEKERGFRELVRRVGPERALSQRFGRKFDIRAIPTAEELSALSIHVCGAFEDWVYALFREEQSLSRPGNDRLYELLSKVRCTWKTRLGAILAGGFGQDVTSNSAEDSLLFSGCYVAAAGETADRQAFVRGVIDKLREEQEFVEWTRDAVDSQRFYSRMMGIGTLAALTLSVTLAAMMAYRWLFKQ